MESLLLGLTIGFGAGMTPGPLTTLVLTTTLQRGFGAGCRVACAPIFTDGPIVLISVLFVTSLPGLAVTLLSVLGGAFVCWLGIDTLRTSRHAEITASAGSGTASQDFLKGIMVNMVSPHPWLFWVIVGGPIVAKAWDTSALSAGAFLAGFFVVLIGSKIGIAGLMAAGRRRMSPRLYRRLLMAAGILLLADGVILAYSAIY